jgi:DNA modification methylase
MVEQKNYNPTGRYPSQTFCDSGTAERLDEQSGLSKGSDKPRNRKNTSEFFGIPNIKENANEYSDTGGCSKILHKCDYENGEMDLYVYAPKVSKNERNAGCDELDDKHFQMRPFAEEGSDMSVMKNRLNSKSGKNNHPTLKPISLSYRVLTLFKTPNPQKIVYPFAGVQSEVIGGYKAGFTDFSGCELNAEFVDIGKVRFDHWKDKPFDEKGKVVEPKKETKAKAKKEEKPKKKPNEQLKLL